MRMSRRLAIGRVPEFKYTYSGTSSFSGDAKGNWTLTLKTGGTLKVTSLPKGGTIDVFLVGGGGGGGNGYASGGGGGGFTKTQSNVSLTKGSSYTITIGTGGSIGVAGGNSSGFGYTANGGATSSGNGNYTSSAPNYTGGNGGSGGGRGGNYGYTGGSDGSGGYPNNTSTGQGTTTREFGGFTNTVKTSVSSSKTFVLTSAPSSEGQATLASGYFITVGSIAYNHTYRISSYASSTRTVTLTEAITASAGTTVRFGKLYSGGGAGRGLVGVPSEGNRPGYCDTHVNVDDRTNRGANSGGGGSGANADHESGMGKGGSGIVVIRNHRA